MRTFLIEKNSAKIRHLGRVFVDKETSVPYFDWSGSGIEFRYVGRVLTGHFLATSCLEPRGVFSEDDVPRWETWPRVAVFLDGSEVPHRVFSVDAPDKDEILFSSEKKEDHTIRIVKLTEAVRTGLGVDSFFGDGEILKPKTSKKPLIEFVGDSITCGYGVLAAPETGFFYTEQEDVTKTYAWQTAHTLGMEPQILAVSGICVAMKEHDTIGFAMKELYPYTNAVREKEVLDTEKEQWDFKHHKADIVVVNLGTNDAAGILFYRECSSSDCDKTISGENAPNGSVDPAGNIERFVKDYKALLADIRSRNGKYTKIVCTLGDMNYFLSNEIVRAIEEFKAETGDTKIWFYKFLPYPPNDRRGTKEHPGLDANTRMARELVAFIKSIQ